MTESNARICSLDVEKTLANCGDARLKNALQISCGNLLQRLLCMPRAQLHAECYKTQHGCSTTLHMHACHTQIIYGIYSVTDSLARSLVRLLALPALTSALSCACACVCACEKCAPSMWNRTQKLGKLLRRSLAKRDRERAGEGGGERTSGRANEA